METGATEEEKPKMEGIAEGNEEDSN